MKAAMKEDPRYDELAFYTLSLGDAEFLHQHVVDAYAAQRAGQTTKPITVVFALAGLYLMLEKGYTGKEVQRAHMVMAKQRHAWTAPSLPPDRGAVTIEDVLAVEPGAAREIQIRKWCASVWRAWAPAHAAVAEMAAELLNFR